MPSTETTDWSVTCPECQAEASTAALTCRRCREKRVRVKLFHTPTKFFPTLPGVWIRCEKCWRTVICFKCPQCRAELGPTVRDSFGAVWTGIPQP